MWLLNKLGCSCHYLLFFWGEWPQYGRAEPIDQDRGVIVPDTPPPPPAPPRPHWPSWHETWRHHYIKWLITLIIKMSHCLTASLFHTPPTNIEKNNDEDGREGRGGVRMMRLLVVRGEVKWSEVKWPTNKEDLERCDQLAGAAIFLFVITSRHHGWVWRGRGWGSLLAIVIETHHLSLCSLLNWPGQYNSSCFSQKSTLIPSPLITTNDQRCTMFWPSQVPLYIFKMYS